MSAPSDLAVQFAKDIVASDNAHGGFYTQASVTVAKALLAITAESAIAPKNDLADSVYERSKMPEGDEYARAYMTGVRKATHELRALVAAVPEERDIHASDCAVHNAPALPVGPCDCEAGGWRPASEPPQVSGWRWIECWSNDHVPRFCKFVVGGALTPGVEQWRYWNPPSMNRERNGD